MNNVVVPDVSIVTITYNEREVIGSFLLTVEKMFQENGLIGEIIVVDDSSPDGTDDVVRRYAREFGNIRLISRPEKMGIGSAFLAGVSTSIGEVIVTMDADLSHPPSALRGMIQKAREGCIIYGSRFLERKAFNTEFHRKVGTLFLNCWMRLFFRTSMRDFTNGYMAFPRAPLNRALQYGHDVGLFPFKSVLYGIPLYVLAFSLNIPTKEVSAPYEFRKAGETKINFLSGLRIILVDMFIIVKLRFILRRQWRGACHENHPC